MKGYYYRIKWYFRYTTVAQIKELVDLEMRGVFHENCPAEHYHDYYTKEYENIPEWMRNHSSFKIEKIEYETKGEHALCDS